MSVASVNLGSDREWKRDEVIFLFLGGPHQVAHLAPVAAEMTRLHPEMPVRCVCADEETFAALREVATAMNADRLQVTRLPLGWFSRLLSWLLRRRSAAKGPVLATVRWRARRAKAIVVPERTSTALRWLGWGRLLIHFRHGAGDRAPSSEKRLGAFDLIVVAGRKDVERALAQGVPEHRLRAVGYVKLDYLSRSAASDIRLFANGAPTVLYNPHFDPTISSLTIARDVIARFGDQDRFNLVYAPHVRATENLSPDERIELMSLEMPGRIVVDLGSDRLFDMTYVRVADVYLGDMSSQLYEFLAIPKPAVFIDAHAVDWEHDPRYAGWRLGSVVGSPDELLDAIDDAIAGHADLIARQREAVRYAFGDYPGAIGRAVSLIVEQIRARDR